MGKFPPKDSSIGHWWTASRIFEREALFYSRMAKELGIYGVDNSFPLCPYANAEKRIIVMEDLKEKGFKVRILFNYYL